MLDVFDFEHMRCAVLRGQVDFHHVKTRGMASVRRMILRCSADDALLFAGIHRVDGPAIRRPRAGFDLDKGAL